jgi:hypothetical protein
MFKTNLLFNFPQVMTSSRGNKKQAQQESVQTGDLGLGLGFQHTQSLKCGCHSQTYYYYHPPVVFLMNYDILN